MVSVLNSEELRKININGLDFVLVLTMLTLEISAAIPGNAEGRVAAIANRFDDFAKGINDARMRLIISELVRSLIATERTA
jgi:hypothetical protein